MLAAGEAGTFIEHDLDDAGGLVPVDRPPGGNRPASSSAWCPRRPRAPGGHAPRGAARRPDQGAGRDRRAGVPRLLAAIDLAALDGRADRVVRAVGRRQDRDGLRHREHGLGRPRCCSRIVEYTQAGGEINVVVAGINVGAQPYWNAEATMLMHTAASSS